MTNAILINEILNDAQLDRVNGGTCDGNMYSTAQYKQAGLFVDTNFWGKDDFFLWSDVDADGKKLGAPRRFLLTYDAANTAVEYYEQYEQVANLADLKKALGGKNPLR